MSARIIFSSSIFRGFFFLLDDRRDISEPTLCESRRLSWKNFIEFISKLNTTSFIHVYAHCFIDFFVDVYLVLLLVPLTAGI